MARDALFLSRTVPCGSGPPEPWRLVVRRRGEDLLVCNPILIPVCFWICAGLSVAGGLFLGLRAGRCPLCLGEGRLVLEITPPQRSASLRECPCAACEGRGRLTALDRWLAGV